MRGTVIGRALAAGLLLILATAAQALARPPNIVVILTDDQDVDSLATMSRLDHLIGRRGIVFERAFVSTALCCPSRATILTGQYAHNTGVLSNAGADGGYAAVLDNGVEPRIVAGRLTDAGYATAMIGKYFNGYPQSSEPRRVPPGWTHWIGAGGNIHNQHRYNLNENGIGVFYGKGAEDRADDVLIGKAIDFIRASADAAKPFMAYLAVSAPHGPTIAAARHEGLFRNAKVHRSPAFVEADTRDKPSFLVRLSAEQIEQADELHRQRLRTLQAIDEGIGAIHATLSELGLLDDTYLIVTSDNGYQLGQHHRIAGKSAPYEESIHVPLMISGPGIGRDQRLPHLVNNADLAPTILELAGLPSDPAIDGRSLVPLLRAAGRPAPEAWRRAMPLAHWNDTDDPRPLYLPPFRGVRTTRYKLVLYTGRPADAELYDLSRDPYETNNIYGSAPARLKVRLTDRLTRLADCSGIACRAIEDRPID